MKPHETPTHSNPRTQILHLMTGQSFGKWTVLEPVDLTGPPSLRKWKCRCDCGTISEVVYSELKRGKSTHCRRCRAKNAGLSRTKFVEGVPSLEHPLYPIWNNMNQRCYNQNCKDWLYYGCKGVIICKRWHTFENFVADIGPRPSPNHSVDRIDNDGNYEPSNCRWATQYEQRHNRG